LLENREKYIWLEKLFIVQEFKNFSNWYKNLIEWTHDIRLAFAGDEFLYCIVRQPKLGDFRSNISAWWSRFLLEENSIPNELWKLTEAIKQNIQYYKNSIFSLDFAFCAEEERWFLMESNYSPGMRYSQYKEHWIECFNKISLFFKEKIWNK
jgi:glutathione synthase/RimK-type ligase-like ATP-grasp enzyme